MSWTLQNDSNKAGERCFERVFLYFYILKGKQYGNNHKSIWIIEEIHIMQIWRCLCDTRFRG